MTKTDDKPQKKRGGSRKEMTRTAKPRFKTAKFVGKRKGESARVTFQRRANTYKKDGLQGLVVRPSRCGRFLRRARKEHTESFQKLVGDYKVGKRNVMYRSFVQTATAGLDAMAHRVLEFAAKVAEARYRGREQKSGMGLTRGDLERAIFFIEKASHE